MHPAKRRGRARLLLQFHARHVFEVVGALSRVAVLACCNAILPRGAAALGSGNDMVDIFGNLAAVLAHTDVAHEDGLAVERRQARCHFDVAP